MRILSKNLQVAFICVKFEAFVSSITKFELLTRNKVQRQSEHNLEFQRLSSIPSAPFAMISNVIAWRQASWWHYLSHWCLKQKRVLKNCLCMFFLSFRRVQYFYGSVIVNCAFTYVFSFETRNCFISECQSWINMLTCYFTHRGSHVGR